MAKGGSERGHILVVDDNKINLMMLRRALDTQGYQVTTAEDGSQALKVLNSKQAASIDVVLLDILMPDVDGYQLLEQIKGDDNLRHIPVIMISALEEMDSVIRSIEMGATDYLHKPYNPALLQARLNASLAEKRLRDLELEYLEQVSHVVKAAESVESSTYDPESLRDVASRDDALGQLASVFQRMANEVHLREQRLKQQLEQLRLDVEDMKKSLSEPLSVYIPMDRRQAMVHGLPLPERTEGSALFADVSGFTPLSEALAQELGGRRGAEELTRILNQVYGALVEEVHRYHGSVVGFSGDAITCWFEGDDGLNAAACAIEMQGSMEPFSMVATPTGDSFKLAIKVSIAAGPARRFLVGDPQIQNIETIAGRTIDLMAAGEQLAESEEVLVHEEISSQYPEIIRITEKRIDSGSGETFAVISELTQRVSPEPWIELRKDVLSEEQCRPWLLPTVYEQARGGSKAFLAELRQAVALFLSFSGIDYDLDDQAGEKLDAFTRWVQTVIAQYDGSLIQLSMGDKGSYLYATFGAPIAHNDDAIRAVYAAHALQEVPAEFEWVEKIKIGVTQGRMRTGAYGSSTRRTYGAQGDKVNLAARLMQAADYEILCDHSVYQAAHARLVFETLPAIEVKGIDTPVPVYRPTGEVKHLTRKKVDLVGRSTERILIGENMNALREGAKKVLIIEGEPGFGKSRLVELVQEFARDLDIRCYLGRGKGREDSTPYHGWQELLWQLTEVNERGNGDKNPDQIIDLRQLYADKSPQTDFMDAIFAAYADHPESSDRSINDGQHKEIQQTISEILREKTRQGPVVLVFEEANELDDYSWDLIQSVSLQINKLLIVLPTRPMQEPQPPGFSQLLRVPNLEILRLKGLSAEESYLLACEHLGVVSLPEEVVEIIERAAGNPQLIEEMVYILRDDGYIEVESGVCKVLPHTDFGSIVFPTTIDGVIKSRLDRLSPSEQLTLKVASVIGMTYSLQMLHSVYPLEADKPYLANHMESMEKLELIRGSSNEAEYTFRNDITFETVYNSMLFSQRRQLHRRVAEWIEENESDGQNAAYAILGDHWLKADDTAKAINYLEKAGQEALKNGDYEAAERYFKECLRLDATASVLSTEFFDKELNKQHPAD